MQVDLKGFRVVFQGKTLHVAGKAFQVEVKLVSKRIMDGTFNREHICLDKDSQVVFSFVDQTRVISATDG